MIRQEPYASSKYVHRLEETNRVLLQALKKIMDRFSDGTIVRDISRDGESDYTTRMMKFVMELNNAKEAIAQAEGKV